METASENTQTWGRRGRPKRFSDEIMALSRRLCARGNDTPAPERQLSTVRAWHSVGRRGQTMRCINVIVIGLISLLVGATANAEEVRGDGNELLQYCTESSPGDPLSTAKSTWCTGYLLGIDDMRRFSAMLPQRPTDCVPEGVTVVQVKSIVVNYLQEYPEELHYSSVVLVHNALKHAFPCTAQPAPK